VSERVSGVVVPLTVLICDRCRVGRQTVLVRLDVLTAEQDAFAALAAVADLTLPVPSCAPWNIGALVRHVSAVHRWAAATARLDPEAPLPDDEPYERRADLLDYPAAASDLRAALTDTARPCPTLLGPGTVEWWVRRQVHEVLVHRFDLAAALGVAMTVDAAVAADCIAEVVDTLQPRQVRLGRMADPEVGGVQLRTPTRVWQLGANPEAEIAGPEIAVALLLWRRIPLQDPRITVTGDPAAAAAFVAQPLTP